MTAILSHIGIALRGLRRDRSGTTAIEYAMIVLFVGLLLISMQNSIGNSVVGFFMSMANGL